MLARNKLSPWIIQPDGDPSWNKEDWARAKTLEARWIHRGLCEQERILLIPCAVWKKKFPGMHFRKDIMDRLCSLENF